MSKHSEKSQCSSENTDDLELMDDEEEEFDPATNLQDISGYSLEEKIVSAVWVHERIRNKMSWIHLMKCFIIRFGNYPPSKRTLKTWERKLFSMGAVKDRARTGRPCARLMHIPYVQASIAESPNMSLRERASELGLPRSTLLKILKYDLKMTFVPDPVQNKFGKVSSNFAQQSGVWTYTDKSLCTGQSSSASEEYDGEIEPEIKLEDDLSHKYDESFKNYNNF